MKCKPCTLQVLANPVGNAVQDNAGLTLHMLQRKKLLLGSAMELDKLLLPLLLLASAAYRRPEGMLEMTVSFAGQDLTMHRVCERIRSRRVKSWSQ